MEIKFVLNEKHMCVDVKADAILMDVLRSLGCKSIKCGCETTNCGLCTVWIDGKSRLSCSVLAASVDGHEIKAWRMRLRSSDAFLRPRAVSSAASVLRDSL